jgi:superfamily I DNA/RNA helicase
VETIQPGDFLLSRVNAPLVETAMTLLREGKRARVAGRDIGAGLKALLRRLAKGPAASSLPALMEKIQNWANREGEKMARAGRQDKADAIADQAAMLVNLGEAARSVSDVEARIDALFTDDGLGQAGVITCSSVHRAKGLEAERVFVLASTLRHSESTTVNEEQNIAYVAITRAKKELVWVA